MTTSATVGLYLRRWRAEHERSQRYLVRQLQAHGLAWTQSTISQVELGNRRVTVEELAVLAVVLGQRPGDLLRPLDGSETP